MSHRRYCLLLLPGLLLLFTGLSHCESQAKCYDVDGRVVEGDAPCNPDAENSPCCGLYWTCLDTGVCTQESTKQILRHEETLLARGTCTDRSWASAQCPNFCLGGESVWFSDPSRIIILIGGTLLQIPEGVLRCRTQIAHSAAKRTWVPLVRRIQS